MGRKISEKPYFSIVMPLFNKEAEVERAIASVLQQSFEYFELIVVNDGSTDNGQIVVEKIEDKRLKIINQVNQGVSAARNRGIKEARADWVAFLDADDEWTPDFLSTVVQLKTDFPSSIIYATSYFYRDPDGFQHAPLMRGFEPCFSSGILNNYFYIASRSDPPIWTSAVCVDKKALLEIGGFPQGVRSGEDLVTWARLAVKGRITYCVSPKAIYHLQSRLESKPVRFPQKEDAVSQLLTRLFEQVQPDRVKDLHAYLSLWHRMRASSFLRWGYTSEARQEVRKMWKHGSRDFKFWVYAFLTVLPSRLVWVSNGLFSKAKSIRNRFFC